MLTTFLRHGSNGALVFTVIALALAAIVGKIALLPGWVVVGALLFYLSEYSWHRFIFHAPPSRFGFVRRLQHRLHYDHHAEPSRLDLLFLPLWFLVPNLVVTGALLTFVLGPARMPATLLGVMLAILHYEWVHFVAHVPHEPRTTFGRWMKQYHLRHHFISEKAWFGVSNPSLDLVYRTWPAAKDVEKSRTVRTLHG
jgi:4-hydroxysphinganine ceramide fatty acyl 2-hydroxylase